MAGKCAAQLSSGLIYHEDKYQPPPLRFHAKPHEYLKLNAPHIFPNQPSSHRIDPSQTDINSNEPNLN